MGLTFEPDRCDEIARIPYMDHTMASFNKLDKLTAIYILSITSFIYKIACSNKLYCQTSLDCPKVVFPKRWSGHM